MVWAITKVVIAVATFVATFFATTSPGEYVPASQVVASFVISLGIGWFLGSSIADLIEAIFERRYRRG